MDQLPSKSLSILADFGEEARVLAGGTDLLPKMKLRRLIIGKVVDLKSSGY